MTKHSKRLLVIIPAAIFALDVGAASAGTTIEQAGVIVCVNDKWDESEPEPGHKLANYAGRCVKVPDDSAAAKATEACSGKYEYMPDGAWTGNGTCAVTFKDGDTLNITWQEGSQLKEYSYKATSGTGKYKGVGGGGSYKYDQLTETLFGGRYHSTWELP